MWKSVIKYKNCRYLNEIPAISLPFFRRERRCFLFIFLLSVIIYCVPVQGQGLSVTYDTGVSLLFKSIRIWDDHLIIGGIYRPEVSAFQSGFISAFDTIGNIQWWRPIKDDSSSITVSDEAQLSLVDAGGVVEPFGFFNRASIGLAMIDSIGQIEFIQEYPQIVGSVTSPRDIIKVHGGYLITGWISAPPEFIVHAFILKTDMDGQQQWFKKYGSNQYEQTSRTITKVNENEFVISGIRYDTDQNMGYSHGWALAIDSMGNKKWEWEANETEVPYRGIMSMQYDSIDRQWVYVSDIKRLTTYPGEDYEVRVPILVQRDSTMNLISYKEYGPYAINHYMGVLEPSCGGGWIAAGSYTTTTDDYVSPIRTQSGRVIKITNGGALEWSVIDTAFYNEELGSRSYLSGVTSSPSGSVYAVGWANNYDENHVYRGYGWLLKITADGCVDTLCTTTSLMDQINARLSPVKVYPNPATDYVIFEVAEEVYDMHAEIFDLNGRRLNRQTLHQNVNVMMLDERFTPGMYVWRVVNGMGRFFGSGKMVVSRG